ncbi:MAG TPA: FAD-dependent oxidoreductase [Solirubrobacteraceae bacterium]|nr:FAD-dependent oxidoreductase [Solirubrobacteraceae bacterium]
MTSVQTERVVVLGGGYAGTIAALRVAGRAHRRAKVTLVDPKETFVQRLRLHQLAAGQNIAAPSYKRLLRGKVSFVQDAGEAIDAERGVVELASGAKPLAFDRLIYTVGSGVDLSTVPGASEHAHSVTDITAATRLWQALRAASDGAAVAVVGAGMTGVETASEIATSYPELSVKLIATGQVGDWLSERAQQHLRVVLVRQGVELVERARVQAIAPDRLVMTDGADLPTGLVIWCGGFRVSDLARRSGLDTDGLGRVMVDRRLCAVRNPHIVAAGDCAATPPFVSGAPLRMCCQAAMPAAAHAGDVVVAQIKGRDPREFHFGYLHQPISLGRRDGLIQFVDRADHPKNSILTGRRAAIYKELITRATIPTINGERRMPGSTKWPFKEPKAPLLLETGVMADAKR